MDVLGYQSRLVSLRQRGREKREITHEQRFHMVSNCNVALQYCISFISVLKELIVKKSKKSRIFNQLVWQEHYCHSLHRYISQ